ncbi:hypothetical protein ARMGADRAFT_1031418 [Armillaria gallica]|uniref:Uncharacterized protein n=1 Tax=Armillaria gallica TaxID=47427 RepID=A0A2H3DWW4_ARMGA|nr:hypothetical protein ARMGADRAFT_1031418 [Armillaria gallica]
MPMLRFVDVQGECDYPIPGLAAVQRYRKVAAGGIDGGGVGYATGMSLNTIFKMHMETVNCSAFGAIINAFTETSYPGSRVFAIIEEAKSEGSRIATTTSIRHVPSQQYTINVYSQALYSV